MIFKVYLMRRGGRKLSWQDTINGPAFVGDLTLCSVTSRHGVYKVAQLITPGGISTVLLPPLYEPVLTGIAPLAMRATRLRADEGAGGLLQRDSGVALRDAVMAESTQSGS